MKTRDSPAYVFEHILPLNMIYIINSFLPKPPKKNSLSPSLEKQLTKIQHIHLKGKANMYMRGLVDFCLD